eukprot:TRINITY_DN7841_c0_g4_i1.p1 TRINITY_DN7841_c0_g4~~TRINITY_DN7841_c0_g4_i1.p1  ORF type:complete len:238 (+),score=29.02 TRINITY_DN7841_c0_g4_i1:123-836(+)
MGALASKTAPQSLPLLDHGTYSLVNIESERGRVKRGVRIVCVSDTHGKHRDIVVPDGDVLIHAGDFTLYGSAAHAADFDAWLAELPHRVKLVVVGNHENNAEWSKGAAEILPHATFLRQSSFDWGEFGGLRFYGTDFFWPCPSGNPYYDQISDGVDVLITHGPASGCADGGKGCSSLLKAVQRVKPALVVSGHVHWAHGAAELCHSNGQCTTLLNAACCGSGPKERSIAHVPLVVEL